MPLGGQGVQHLQVRGVLRSNTTLEALRMMISHAASGRTRSRGGRKILVIDARKAHLHAMADREVYVDFPPEQQVPGMCARLNRCFYGIRDVPAR